ncbi:MAG TPA: hypothetical protein VII78_00060 [Myxococcota bacterium]|jgi:hypothetical protein
MRSKVLLALALAAFATSAAAQTVPAGSGTLNGGQRIQASGCGKDTDSMSVALNLAANGTWTATVDGDDFSGTSSSSGRVTTLTLDGGSLAELGEELEEEATELCEESVAITSLSVTQAQLKLNKRRTMAKLQLKASGTGMTSGGSGTGKFRLKANGAWQTLP